MVPPAAELSTGRWLGARLLCFLGCRAELSDRKIVRSDRTRRNRAARPGHHVKMWLSGGGFGGDAVAHRYQLCDVVACSAFGVDPRARVAVETILRDRLVGKPAVTGADAGRVDLNSSGSTGLSDGVRPDGAAK